LQNLIGQSIGRYHIIEQLGEGGMAIVYKAFDTTLDCDVAVKVIRIDELSPVSAERTLKRFKREAKETAQLLHPNIVRVTDYGEFEGAPFLVMPFLPGGTLKEQLDKLGSPMPYPEASRLLVPIARALDFAHKRGIAHRDVKPANILITEDGQPMLTDFGVAKILENDRRTTELTGSGMAIGTPEYMAPEQWMGRELDSRADIYSLGVVFYEMITGRTPFSADTVPAVMVMALRDPLPRPRDFVKGLPEDVEQIIFKALAREPENRYQDMTQFANDLDRLVLNEKVKLEKREPAGISNLTLNWIYAGLGILVVLSAMGFYFLNRNNAGKSEPAAESAMVSDQNDATIQNQSKVTPSVVPAIQTPILSTELIGSEPNPGDYHWEFEKDGNLENWGDDYFENLNTPIAKNGLLELHSNSDDPYISGPGSISIDSTIYKQINLRMKVSAGFTGQIYFITETDKTYDEVKKIEFPIMGTNNFEDYLIDIGSKDGWRGKIIGIRLDPTDVADSNIWVDYIRLDPALKMIKTQQKNILQRIFH
jgi:serine/threonine protein kinase